MAMREVVKVQIPVASNVDDAPALIYGEGHRHQELRTITPELLARMAERPKAYFWAIWKGGAWQLEEEAPPQRW
jgi:hypothetical protein